MQSNPAVRPTGKQFGVQVITDSVNRHGNRLITIVAQVWRPILAEVNTHRALSKSAPSSRGINPATLIKRIKNNPARPTRWVDATDRPKGASTMTAGGEMEPALCDIAWKIWLNARDVNIDFAKMLSGDILVSADGTLWIDEEISGPAYRITLHRSYANRLTEPWMITPVVITSTDWQNVWAQRDSPLAQPEFEELAIAAQAAINASTPRYLAQGEWHLPFEREEDKVLSLEDKQHVCVARCARASHLQFAGHFSHDEDVLLYTRLVTSQPKHMGPFEHVATPTPTPVRQRNLNGWRSLRCYIPDDTAIDERYDGPVIVNEAGHMMLLEEAVAAFPEYAE